MSAAGVVDDGRRTMWASSTAKTGPARAAAAKGTDGAQPLHLASRQHGHMNNQQHRKQPQVRTRRKAVADGQQVADVAVQLCAPGAALGLPRHWPHEQRAVVVPRRVLPWQQSPNHPRLLRAK